MLLNDLATICNCEDLAKSSADIASILEDGDVPLISVPVNGRLCISRTSLSRGESTIEFAAISHVRSQSLAVGDGSSVCSLRRLQSLVDGLPKASAVSSESNLAFPWWIDVVCIPESQGKKRVNAMIKRIFEAAAAVLVLDTKLCHWVPASIPDCRNAIRQSPWMKRLWTLQEISLARRVYFRFFEKTISLADIIGSQEFALDGTIDGRISTVNEVDIFRERGNVHDKLRCLDRFDEDLKSLGPESMTSSEDVSSTMRNTPDAGSHKPLDTKDDSKCTSKINKSILDKSRLKSLLRLGYLSLPWFQLISDQYEYSQSQVVMAKIISLYDVKSEKGRNAKTYMSMEEKLMALAALQLDIALEDPVG